LSFQCVKSSSSCSTLGSQLQLDVTSSGAGKVSFRLLNDGSDEKLTASQLFFDDGGNLLLDITSVTDGAGVDFAEGGKPANLKSGKKIGFFADFIATAAKPNKLNGVNEGEFVQINFSLENGVTLEDVLEALASGDLRLGVHAKNAFVTANGTVPEPGALALLAVGGAALALRSRRS
jgi:hypothetical protein